MRKSKIDKMELARYTNLRKQTLQKITKLEKSRYGKDLSATISYYKERLIAPSKIKTARELKFASIELERASATDWSQAERKRQRKKRVEWLQEELGKEQVKNIKDVKRFDEFMEAIRNFSIGSIYDSETAINIIRDNPNLGKKATVEKYNEYKEEFIKKHPKYYTDYSS